MRRPWYRPSLTTQIMIGLVVGGMIGWLRPDWGNAVYFLRDIFINLIKSIIAPLVFSTIVAGIAGAGALRKVGRMGVKALVYFEIVTTAALFFILLAGAMAEHLLEGLAVRADLERLREEHRGEGTADPPPAWEEGDPHCHSP